LLPFSIFVPTEDAAMTRARERIGALEAVIESPRRIAIEAL
jgi:hypothetical protein